MAEVGFVRRVAPAVGLAVAGGILLYLLHSGADNDTSADGDVLDGTTISDILNRRGAHPRPDSGPAC